MLDDDDLKSRYNLLLEEYKCLISQIIHWDSHFWDKSKFFLAIESVFLGAALATVRDVIKDELKVHPALFIVLFVTFIFNLYLNYVWFRTNRRNREYLDLRLVRARWIEKNLSFDQIISTFTSDHRNLQKKYGSAKWEIYLPAGFAVAWIATFIGALMLLIG